MLRICSRFALLSCLAGPGLATPIIGTVTVVDGDTFKVAGTTIRLYAIDAPETDQHCETEQGTDWACGGWVTRAVQDRFNDAIATCQPLDTDKYGRTVARCEVWGMDVGEWLVSEGMAFAYVRYGDEYVEQEKAAAIVDRGLHAVRLQSPAQHRATRAKGRMPPDATCRIKGNISAKGERIFHLPGQMFYERTGIREGEGERWFCSATAAQAAGWRPAKR